MKKIRVGMLAVAIGILLVTGCQKQESKPEDTGINMEELADSLKEEIAFHEEMKALDEKEISNYIEVEDGAVGHMYMGSGSSADVIVIFETKDSTMSDAMEQNLELFMKDQKDAFADYMPQEASKIEDAVLVKKGNYVILCVSPESDKAEDIIEKAFK